MQTSELPRVFVGAQAVAEGLLTAKQLRGPHLRRVLHGVYRPATVRDSHALHVEAAGLILPERAMVTGRSACTALGVTLSVTDDPVTVLVPEREPLGRSRAFDVRRAVAVPDEHSSWRGVRLAPGWRIAIDLVARQELAVAVSHLDAAARGGVVDLEALRRRLPHLHCHHVAIARQAAELADPRAQSIPESQTRVILTLAGIEVEPQVKVPLPHGGSAVCDLAVAGRRIAVEYDGAWHALREQLQRDRRRLNDLREAGWSIVHVTADLLHAPHELVARVRAAMLGPAEVR